VNAPDRRSTTDALGLSGRTISHFTVREPLGAGGMGVVYRAEDTLLGRPVALKFLLPQYNFDDIAKSRFLREAHSAAALNHPNLCTIHEVGTSDDGWLFLAMPLYVGETLRARLARDGALPVEEALDIARQIGEGLEAAHALGIVHRDLKPGNLMLLPDGAVRILDFGLAKSRDQSLTATGVLLGTVSYMSPEQLAGAAVDARADLWALGVVLYEMLTGHLPFPGDQDFAVAQAILHAEPAFPSAHGADLSPLVEELVLTLLRKDPSRRYDTATEMLQRLARASMAGADSYHELRRQFRRAGGTVYRRRARIAQTAMALLLIGAGTVALFRAPRTGSASGAPVLSASSVAVLPFTNVGADAANEPFSDGMADELTTALGKVKGVIVAARASAFSLNRKGLDPREIGRQLTARYVVVGRVRRVNDRQRVGVDLIDVTNGRQVWSKSFENAILNRDEFIVQDSITRSIVHQLLPHISALAVAAAVQRPTEDPEAHALYVEGRYFFEKRDSAGFAKAQEYFRRAIKHDSSYAAALAGLSDAYSHQAIFGFVPPAENIPLAKQYAARALADDSTLAEVHTSLAFIALFYDWNWRAAGSEFEKAFRLDERYPPPHVFHAWYLLARDSVNAAIAEGRRAIDLDPFSALNQTRLVSFLFYAGRYGEALAQALKVLDRDPNYGGLRQELARVYVHMGHCRQALAVLEQSADQPAGILRGTRGYTYAKCGRREQALAELERLRTLARAGKYVSHYGLAVIQAGLGDREQAVAELQQGYTERVWAMYMIRLEPAFAELRSDPRFQALERKVGLIA
jgi:serine/threonine-protein kinase